MLNAPMTSSNPALVNLEQLGEDFAARTISGISLLSGLSGATSGSALQSSGSVERLNDELKKLEMEQERLENEVNKNIHHYYFKNY